jgi:hypothetical protein
MYQWRKIARLLEPVVPVNRQGLNTSKGQKCVTVLYLTKAGYAEKYRNDNPQSGELGRPIRDKGHYMRARKYCTIRGMIYPNARRNKCGLI